MSILSPDDAGIDEAIRIIAGGGVAAYPTETVYGLAVNPFSELSLDALFKVKARDDTHPVLLIVADETQINTLTSHISENAQLCMNAFWPGPISLLFPALDGIPKRLLGDSGHVCVRCPDHEVARSLCRRFGGPVTSTSANLSGLPPARSAVEALLPGVSLVLDGGVLEMHSPSTVYDPDTGTILRSGPITIEMIAEASLEKNINL
jgi:L-threonylcarbamoyladenylate synthase